MKGFVKYGLNTYDMLEVTESEMDKLIQTGGDSFEWPYRYCPETRRVWPKLIWDMEVFFHD
jgi:hypothetical protein